MRIFNKLLKSNRNRSYTDLLDVGSNDARNGFNGKASEPTGLVDYKTLHLIAFAMQSDAMGVRNR